MCSTPREPSADAAVRNWRESDLPFFPRLWVALRNTARKIVTRKSCCGNYGQPGC
jgi:hypothetical protein